MSSFVDNSYSTLEEHLKSLRSPTLSRTEPNFDSSDTPPPFVDAPDDFEPDVSGFASEGLQTPSKTPTRPRIQPSLTDVLLIRELGPTYDPDIAAQAGRQLCCDEPEAVIGDKTPDSLYAPSSMFQATFHEDVYTTSDHQALVQQALKASRRASEKLNDAMRFPLQIDNQSGVNGVSQFHSHHSRDKKRVSISITSLTNDEESDSLEVAQLSIGGSPSHQYADVLPPLNLRRSPSNPLTPHQISISHSPSLSKYAISPQDFDHTQTLARIQSHPSPQSNHASPTDFKQTLPSLETALGPVSAIAPGWADPASAASRRSPNHLSPFGRSPPSYPQNVTAVAPLSPSRLPAPPTTWRTLSNNSSNSASSDHISAPGSNNASTPASSAPRHSPPHSMATPQYPESERHDSPGSDVDTLASSEGGIMRPMSSSQGFSCDWPGCTAPPFQTQYLLNSHTNVHSNQRPHFCPVKDCPRGPGGQGFKRKNEMIRHGLVHQSPGYICPFCVDQQHKYPRPDNLQRHVRVHHVDKDRDDPMLRDVLAQRPEGGNRGRRRRLGT